MESLKEVHFVVKCVELSEDNYANLLYVEPFNDFN